MGFQLRNFLPITFSLIYLATSAHADVVKADGKRVDDTSPFAAAGKACLSSVAQAREWASSVLGSDTEAIQTSIVCEVKYDQGCGSGMVDRELEFLSDDPRCHEAVFIPSFVFHEWAHLLNHRFAHVTAQPFDEALADTFAVFMTGNPKFGEGLYIGRDRTWMRDVSEKKNYEGPRTKQIYTQSLTLSGAWWDFSTRLNTRLGELGGKELTKLLFLTHLKLMNASKDRHDIEDDYGYASEAIGQQNLSVELAAQVRCDLTNSFLDHGFKPIQDGCTRESHLTDDEKILARMGKPEAHWISGKLLDKLPLKIADPTVRDSASPTVISANFDVTAAEGARVRALVLKLRIVHNFPDDILIRVTAPDGKTFHDIYKGEEEVPLPDAFTDRYKFLGARAKGKWKVEILDYGFGDSVTLKTAKLLLWI